MLQYINALGTTNYFHVNCRAYPDNNSRVEWYLTSVGVIADFVEELNEWRKYIYGGVEFWVHKSEHDWVDLESKWIVTEFVSQNNETSGRFPNDCGPASIATLMRFERPEFTRTVDQLSIDAGMQGNQFTNFNQLISIARMHGFDPQYVRPLYMTTMLRIIYSGTPVLCLVYYDKLQNGKRYGHFLVALGYDDGDIITHDPNARGYLRYPVEAFAEALAQIGTSGNMPFQGLYFKGKKK